MCLLYDKPPIYVREREPWDKFGPCFSLRPGLSIPILAQKYFRYSFSLWQVGVLPATKKTNNDNIFSYQKINDNIFLHKKKKERKGKWVISYISRSVASIYTPKLQKLGYKKPQISPLKVSSKTKRTNETKKKKNHKLNTKTTKTICNLSNLIQFLISSFKSFTSFTHFRFSFSIFNFQFQFFFSSFMMSVCVCVCLCNWFRSCAVTENGDV